MRVLSVIGLVLATALAFGQTQQSDSTPPNNAQQPAAQQPAPAPPAKPRPAAPHSVADAARASKQIQESAPPAKVYRNKDVKDPADAGNPAAAAQPPAAQAAPKAVALSDDEQIKKDRAFEAQAKIFKNQILVEKGKIVDIQNRMTDLKYQFDEWAAEFSQDPTDAQSCWNSQYYTPYYRDWCDAGRKLKAQYDAAQVQLTREKARLEQMQENIRRQGYGNGVYDAD